MEKLKKIINFKQLIKGVLVFLLFYYSSLFQLIPISLFDMNTKSGSNQVILSTFSNCCLLLILVLIYRKELKVEWKKFKDNFMSNMDIGIKYWLLGLFLMMVSNLIINLVLGAGGAENEKAVQQMITSLPWLMLISAGLIAPITEEIVFRKCFKNAFVNKWLFIILSGLIFGALHVVTSFTNPLQLLYIIPYGSLGLSFAIMYNKTNTVCTSIAMHMLHNITLTIISIISL